MNHITSIKAARRCGTPLIVATTVDPQALIEEISEAYGDNPPAILKWNIIEGVVGLNQKGLEAQAAVNGGEEPALTTGNPVEALMRLPDKLPDDSILFFLNAHLFVEGTDDSRKPVIQGISNLRDCFKASRRTLVMVAPDIKMPRELENDTMTVDVPLPGRVELAKIIRGVFESARLEAPAEDHVEAGVNALTGLSSFRAEQISAMSIRKTGLDLESMWDAKIKMINQTSGLQVSRRATSFDDIGGLDEVKAFCRLKIGGKRRPKLVVLIDEIGDQMAGLNDSNGINRDAQSQLLTSMQDNNWSGMFLHGVAGTGKTETGNAMGCEAGGLFITFDMGGMKGGIVSESEKMIRAAVKILYAMGGEDVFFIGTTNSLAGITPQMKRRFGTIFFYDLLTKDQQEAIWGIYLKKFGLEDQKRPDYSVWTGAEIKKCCALADEFGCSLIEASKYITPVVKAMGGDLEKMRKDADGKYLSASAPGYYKYVTGKEIQNKWREISLN